MASNLISKNVNINGLRTSLRLESEIWAALEDICTRESLNVHKICTLIDQRRHGSSRTSAVRAFIVTYFRAAASDAGTTASKQGKPRRLVDLLAPYAGDSGPFINMDGFAISRRLSSDSRVRKTIRKTRAS